MPSRLLAWGTLCLALLLTGLTAPSYAAAGDEGLPLRRPLGGRAAISALGDDVSVAARLNHMTAAKLTRILTTDPTANLDTSGRMFYVEPAPASASAAPAAAATYPYAQTFQLHSLPGSNRTIFLDFDGHTVSNTAWNQGYYNLPEGPYSGMNMDSVAGFSEAEQDLIQEVFTRVAEDYAPMNVDVTTEDPGLAALERADEADQQYGMRVLISDDPLPPQMLCSNACGGIAYLDAFDQWINHPGEVQPAWMFANKTNYNPRVVSDAISHELGHTLGLNHDGQTPGADYYAGQGMWLPIMGSGLKSVSQFSNGDYLNANNQQDDFAVMASHGALTRTDDYGNVAASAASIDEYGVYPGVISTRNDLDWFTVEHCSGPFSVNVAPAAAGPNLNIRLTVQNSAGATVAVNPTSDFGNDALGASYAASLAAGTYRLVVDGAGEGNPAVDGFSDYGSVGQYTIAVDTSCTTLHAPSVPQVFTVETADNGTAATLNWAPSASDGGASVTSYTVGRTGGTPVVLGSAASSHTFTGLAAGTAYTFTVRAANTVGTGPAASLSRTTPKAATAPQGLSATVPASGEADLHWATPLNDGGRPIIGYVVQRTGGSPVSLPADAREHHFTGLVSGSYTMSVRATTAFGPGAVATFTYQEPGPPSAPQGVSAVATSSSFVEVTWGLPASNGGSTILSYSITLNGSTQTVAASSPRLTYFGGLTPDTTYEASVTASNSFGPGVAAVDSVHTPAVTSPPGAVQSLALVDATRSTIKVSWAAPSDLGGLPLQGYQTRLNSGSWGAVSAALERTFSGLAANTHYTVWVRAVNSDGAGAAQSLQVLTDPPVRPGAPRIGTAVAGLAGGSVTAKAVWRAPLSSGGAAITSYRVTALKMSSTGTVLRRFTKTVGPSVRATSMILPAGRYRFQVVAINVVGPSPSSARSNLVTAR